MGKFIKILIFLCIVFNLFICEGKAYTSDKENINFKSITIEDGLSQTSVMYVYQDSDGYMWFGTNDGLNKYDGNKFTIYRSGATNENSIVSNYVTCITEDSKKNLWIGTSNGVSKMNINNGEVTNYTVGDEEGNLSHSNVCEIFIDSKDRIWIATVDGVNLYDEENDKFNRVLFDDKSNKSYLTSQFIFSIVEDSNGVIWIGTDDGVNSYNEKTGEIKHYKNDSNNENSLSGNNVYDLYSDKEYIYVATIGDGLNKINVNTEKITRYLHQTVDSNGLPGDEVTSILRDNNDRLWIGTNGGLVLLNEEEDKLYTYKSKIYDTTTLANDNVYNLFQDESGMIWIGTLNGISTFNPESIFTTYRNDPFDENTIVSNMIQGIYVDDDGLIWVGGNGRGLSIIDREKNKVHRYSNKESGKDYLTSDKITCIIGNEDFIWVGTENGLNKIDKKNNTINKYLWTSSNELHSVIRDLFIDSKGILWVSTKNGLFTLDIKKDEITDKGNIITNNIKEDKVISSVFEDSEGFIWIGFGIDGGLLKYNQDTNEFIQYKSNVNDEFSISFNAIKDIQEDSKGNIWIATNKGLNKLDKSTGRFTRYYEDSGLANSYVYSVLLDDDDNPWVSTNYGLSKYDNKTGKFINFNVNDGLQGNEFNFNSQCKSKDGEMFFGGINGINSFYPQDLKVNSYLAPVKINEITIDGNHVDVKDEIVVNYNQNILNIRYFVADYKNPKRIEYFYKLEGINKEWVYAEDANYIRYNSLPAGKYTLKVIARNQYGDFSEVSQINIIKKQYPWKTPQAIIAYIILGIIIIVIVWNRMRILDSIIKQRTYELDNKLKKNELLYNKIIEKEKKKNNYFINLSHELRTPLNVILSVEQLITVLNEKDESIDRSKISHYMGVLRSNSNRLLKLINDIIDTSKIESGTYKLDIAEHDIVYRVEEVALSMKDFIESKGLELIIDPKIEEKIIECDIDDIEKCLINIIGNAVKFTPSGGTIEINIEDFVNKVKISISDTGIGIDKKNIDEIFNRFGQLYNKKSEEFGGSGIGLELTKHLIVLHNGNLEVESELGKGSTFTIMLPVKQKNKVK